MVAIAITAGMGAAMLAASIGSRTAVAQVDPASHAIAYLQTQQSATDGSLPDGSSTNAVSEQYAIGAAAAGYDPKVLRNGSGPSVMTYLAAHATAACATAGGCGLLIQAVVAARMNPASFGGVNLVSALNAMYHSKTGVYGDGEAFTESLAVQGLAADGQTIPTAATHHLAAAQDSDGGWDYLLIKDDPNGGTNFDTSDTNSTAMVLMALNAAGTRGRNATALAWLHTQQDSDGGFPYQAGAGTDPNSTALVLQGLIAAAQNPAASNWAVGGNTALSNLLATQDADGGYTFPGSSGPDPFTTAQVPAALDLVAYPVAGVLGSKVTLASEAAAGTATVQYLQTQQSATDGSIPEGSSTDAVSEQYAIGAAAAGYDPKVLRNGSGPSVMTYLAAHAAAALYQRRCLRPAHSSRGRRPDESKLLRRRQPRHHARCHVPQQHRRVR